MVEAGPHSTSIRREPLSGRETVFADIRDRRPRPEEDHDCPFCPGNERLLAEIIWQLDGPCGWRTRAVSNRYPIVAPPAGRHEIIIESPDHPLTTAAMTPETWRDVLATWSLRHRALASDWRYVTLYRNAGRRAGATIDHPHSHLVAMSHVPAAVRATRRRQRRAGRCLLCDQVERAGGEGRIVARSAHYAVLVPEVPEVSFEVWVAPRAHTGLFAPAGEEPGALAAALHDLFDRMHAVLGDFGHNMMLEGAGPGESPHLHWFLRLRPRLEYGGGFEFATGMSVNASDPAADAAALRDAGATGRRRLSP